MKTVYLLSLGCPRNMLDSEVLMGLLERGGFEIADSPESAEAAIVNTCGFITQAKEESVEMILRLAELKQKGAISFLVVAGCLSQRYPDELIKDIPEIDAVFGTSDFTAIPERLKELEQGAGISEVSRLPEYLYDESSPRKLLTPAHSVYVKIQEGCSNSCSYCVIPGLKGPRRSRTIGSVVEEVKSLKAAYAVKELVMIGQDTTSFGMDKGGEPLLAELLRRVSPLMRDGWVRLLYTHPAHFGDELIRVIADTPNICKYVDLPIQHINDRILKAMNRKVTSGQIATLLGKIRKGINDVTVRTSVIVGFPGETEEEFAGLLEFLSEARFDRLGAFMYSREEGTQAARISAQVPEEVIKERFDRVMSLQQKISAENNRRFLGREIDVLIDERDTAGNGYFTGRGEMDAPEVDGVVYLKGKDLKPGSFTRARITGTLEYDLTGEAV